MSLLYDLYPYGDLPHPDQRTLESAQLDLHDAVVALANDVAEALDKPLKTQADAVIVIGLLTGLCRIIARYETGREDGARLLGGLVAAMPVEIEYWRNHRVSGDEGCRVDVAPLGVRP